MDTPHYLRFVRALALLAGAGCSTTPPSPPPAPDVAPDVEPDAVPDGPPDRPASDVPVDLSMDVPLDGQAEDRLPPRDVSMDAGDARDGAGPDASTDVAPDLSPRLDVTADEGGTAPDGATSPDVPSEASLCPPTPPRDGSPCTPPMLSCNYTMEGGGFTSCTCTDMGALRTWNCATAVPGPLPPPEFAEAL